MSILRRLAKAFDTFISRITRNRSNRSGGSTKRKEAAEPSKSTRNTAETKKSSQTSSSRRPAPFAPRVVPTNAKPKPRGPSPEPLDAVVEMRAFAAIAEKRALEKAKERAEQRARALQADPRVFETQSTPLIQTFQRVTSAPQSVPRMGIACRNCYSCNCNCATSCIACNDCTCNKYFLDSKKEMKQRLY